MTYSISFSVCERDIDLLLLEEFVTSLEFLQWFSDRVVNISIKVDKLLDAQRSVIHPNGESDLKISLQDSTGRTAYLLIENKINAIFQPQQAERYQIRGQDYREKGDCKSVQTVLVAPERYFSSDTALEGFDSRVTYEEIRDWFTHQKWMKERRHYKVALLNAAIEKRTIGYDPVEDDSVTTFWYQYWQLTREKAPALNMKEPVSKPSGASSILFKSRSLPLEIKLVHKLPSGKVDLEFSGKDQPLEWLKQKFENLVDADMSFEKAGKSGCIRLQVPPVNTAHEFDTQKEACFLGIRAATRLLTWYEQFGRNHSSQRWSRMAK